jgi:FMN phosphatase YigB (HAD superfamily)
MLKTVLFDLDNTLIFFDEHEFFDRYMRALAPVFSDLWPFELFYRRMIESVQFLLHNDGTRTNAERFMECFAMDRREGAEDLWNRFVRFYETEFDQFRTLVRVPEGIAGVFEELRMENVKLVIASNPLWPLSIQQKRLSWAGLDGFPFDLITHIENTSFCKPNIEYYREICRFLDAEPESCLMVGNDVVNDMVVSRIGMKTFLLQDGLADPDLSLSRELRKHAQGHDFRPDYRGTLSDVPAAVRTGTGISGRTGWMQEKRI